MLQKLNFFNLDDGFAWQGLSSEDRAQILFNIAASLEANEKLIMAENDLVLQLQRAAG